MKIWDHKIEWIEVYFALAILFFIVYIFFFRDTECDYTYLGMGQEDMILLRKKKHRFTKKHEEECRRILQNIFKRPFASIRPKELRYPLTGRNLELDCYNPELRLALEYQGRQHYKYTPVFHKNYEEFVAQINRDQFKKQRCRELGITLIEIPYTVKMEDLSKRIKNELREFKLLK